MLQHSFAMIQFSMLHLAISYATCLSTQLQNKLHETLPSITATKSNFAFPMLVPAIKISFLLPTCTGIIEEHMAS
jgi:hypothetical protein